MSTRTQVHKYAYAHNIENAEYKRVVSEREVLNRADALIDLNLRISADLFRSKAYLSDAAIARLNAVSDTARFKAADNPENPHPILDTPEILCFLTEITNYEHKPPVHEPEEVSP